MKRSTYLLALILSLACCSSVMARDKIFGLDWQSTPAQLRAKGIQLTQQKAQGRLTMYLAQSLPVNLSDAESYLLIFDRDEGLVKILMVGKDIVSDPDGARGKKRFQELGDILVHKGYKAKGFVDNVPKHPPGGFYACLYQAACGVWQRVFTKDGVDVLLRLRGTEGGTGYIMMSFEEQPQFAQALKKNKQSAMDKDAAAF